MDKLKYFLTIQNKFQKNFFDINKLSHEEKINWIKEFSIELIKELGEFLSELKSKHHRLNEKIIYSNLYQEWIDIFKYLINISILIGLNEKKIFEEFNNKTKIVEQRYKQEMKLKNLKNEDKLIAFDIDDTICKYSEYFCTLFNKKYKTKYDNIITLKIEMPTQYIKFKDYYRNSGLKQNIPLKENVKEILDYFNKLNYKIILISARPYKKYYRIFSDTLIWLDKNKLKYDAIYFDDEKSEKLFTEFSQLKFIVEDNLEFANRISSLKFKVYLLNNKYNIGNTNNNVIRINNLSELIDREICK